MKLSNKIGTYIFAAFLLAFCLETVIYAKETGQFEKETELEITLDAEDVEGLTEEFTRVSQENAKVLEEYELLKKERRTSVMWGVILGVLGAATFAVGILSLRRRTAEEENGQGKAGEDELSEKMEIMKIETIIEEVGEEDTAEEDAEENV